jgi:hypothetical protein
MKGRSRSHNADANDNALNTGQTGQMIRVGAVDPVDLAGAEVIIRSVRRARPPGFRVVSCDSVV